MQRSVWKADSIRQFGYRRLRNVQKVVVTQYVDGTAHIAPQGRTLPDLRKIEAKSIDRPNRNVRPFIWPSPVALPHGRDEAPFLIARRINFARNGIARSHQVGFAVTIPEQVIKDAVARYDRERDRYLKLAARVADICRINVVEANAIRAQVTSRAKTSRSLEGKLRRFAKRPDKNMPTVDTVFEQIGDLAAVRVATYRPEDQDRVVEEIKKLFSGGKESDVAVDRKDKLKDGGFYRATHCQAALRDDELVGTYENLKGTSCEIQICSMMAHVFNEVEHDIAYKPEGGGPQEAEKGLLDALGHLTRTGDHIVSQLLAANEARMKEQTGDFNDAFDFVARLRKQFPGADLSGNAGQLFDEIQSLKLTSLDKLKQDIGEGRFNTEAGSQIVDDFNAYLANKSEMDFLLDKQSSDLVLALILDKHAAKIEENHPAGRGMGRPPRIRSIATRFLEFRQQPPNAPAA